MRSEYQTRINRVIAHIDANLGEDLSLEQLACVACFSEYHFHRLFRGIVGESLNEFVQRRRLETAARALYLRFFIIGIEVRTNNRDEMTEKGKIGPEWQKFYSENILSQIPGKRGDAVLATTRSALAERAELAE